VKGEAQQERETPENLGWKYTLDESA